MRKSTSSRVHRHAIEQAPRRCVDVQREIDLCTDEEPVIPH